MSRGKAAGIVIALIIILGIALFYFKSFRYTDISDVVEGESYTFKLEFSQFAFTGGAIVDPQIVGSTIPGMATVVILEDSTGNALLGAIENHLWFTQEYVEWMFEQVDENEFLPGVWVMKAKVVDVNVPNVVENSEPLPTSQTRPFTVNIAITVDDYHKASWWE